MARSLLPLTATLLMGFTVCHAKAADHSSLPPSSSSDLRVEVDTKREQITGADDVERQGSTGSQTIVDTPVDTADAPSADEEK